MPRTSRNIPLMKTNSDHEISRRQRAHCHCLDHAAQPMSSRLPPRATSESGAPTAEANHIAQRDDQQPHGDRAQEARVNYWRGNRADVIAFGQSCGERSV